MAIGRDANLFFWGFYGDPTRMTESGKRVFLNAFCYIHAFGGHAPLVARKSPAREAVFDIIYWIRKPISTSESFTKYLIGRIDPKILESAKMDPDALEREYRARLEYVGPSPDRRYTIDADLEALQLSNRKPQFFEALAARLAKDPKDPQALRLLERYAPQAPRDAAALETWLGAHRGSLFFSDIGGYRWVLDPRARSSDGSSAR
jgi:hypothetical protein